MSWNYHYRDGILRSSSWESGVATRKAWWCSAVQEFVGLVEGLFFSREEVPRLQFSFPTRIRQYSAFVLYPYKPLAFPQNPLFAGKSGIRLTWCGPAHGTPFLSFVHSSLSYDLSLVFDLLIIQEPQKSHVPEAPGIHPSKIVNLPGSRPKSPVSSRWRFLETIEPELISFPRVRPIYPVRFFSRSAEISGFISTGHESVPRGFASIRGAAVLATDVSIFTVGPDHLK
ncbi:hypothetical protein K438DRAFT_1770911 [Mycena galopus ATCC 62051]|nr:hypothetical protein K438DRAFT_1770911 [Mycena galopus ATCC 62051]